MNETAGERVRRLRKNRQWTQSELAFRIAQKRIEQLKSLGEVEAAEQLDPQKDSNPTIVSRIERGFTETIKQPMAEILSEIFDTTPEYIMYGDKLQTLYPPEVYRFLTDPDNTAEVNGLIYTAIARRQHKL